MASHDTAGAVFRLVAVQPSSGGWLHDAEEIRAPSGNRVEETGIAVLDESAVHAVDAVTVADPIEVLWDEGLVRARDVDGGSADDQRFDVLLLVLFHMWFLSGQMACRGLVLVCFGDYMVALLNRACKYVELTKFNSAFCAGLTLLNSSMMW